MAPVTIFPAVVSDHCDFSGTKSPFALVTTPLKLKATAEFEVVLVGGCVLAVDLLTVSHEALEKTSIPLQSNLLTATAFMEPLKKWMFIDKDGEQVGPVEMLSEGFGQRRLLTGQPSARLPG
ncbi:PREDICTED: uncharacterized protein LOC104596555 [Nelumbo nucifera]|uniref:Uncharacterized protein LOC104596555 n=1 Tax=Nelumbo nucifera TaxID=4432 RepID=A0A1U7ZPL0_NELNU|nr:PREDICTED: uncharacterized protein LOC104596555 [Nelumbo nucifera]